MLATVYFIISKNMSFFFLVQKLKRNVFPKARASAEQTCVDTSMEKYIPNECELLLVMLHYNHWYI